MQPGYPGSGQEPYGTQPPYPDPYAQPRYGGGPPADRPAPRPRPGEPAAETDQTDADTNDARTTDAAARGAGLTTPPPAAAPEPAPAPPAGGRPTRDLIGMVLGVVSIPGAFCTALGVPFAILCGALAIGYGIAGVRRARAGLAANRAQAVTAIVCGAIGVVLGLIGALTITRNGAA